jgi:cell division protein FtsN
MKIQLITFFLTLNLCVPFSYAQGISDKWEVVIEDDLKTIAIDTTSIGLKGEQISFWVLEEYKKIQEFSESGLKIKKAKSQYLINPATSRYSIIGKLFYDDMGQVAAESSTPGLSGGGEGFYIVIEPNSVEEMLLTRALAYIDDDSGRYEAYLQKLSQKSVRELSDTSAEADENKNVGNSVTEGAVQKNVSTVPGTAAHTTPGIPSGESKRDDPAPGSVRIYDDATGEYVELNDRNSAQELSSENSGLQSKSQSKPADKYKYDVTAERNVTGTIFTDGKKYCFQVSSWRKKSTANQEVERLKRAGYSAYLVEGRPENKKGVWYRVRIGYFDTLDEVEHAEDSFK